MTSATLPQPLQVGAEALIARINSRGTVRTERVYRIARPGTWR